MHKWLSSSRLSKGLLGLVLLLLGSAKLALAYDVPVVVESVERVVLSAESAGVITAFNVTEGAQVKQGDAIATLATKELQLDLKVVKQELNFLYKKIENLKKLVARGLATDEEIGELRLQRDVLRSQVKLLEYRIARSTLKAPFPGKIVQRLAQPHEWVQQGQPVVELLNTAQLRVVADVPASYGAQLQMGDTIDLQIPVLNTQIQAKLSRAAPAVDVKSNTLRVYAEVIEPPAALLSGMTGVWGMAQSTSGSAAGVVDGAAGGRNDFIGPPQ